MAGINYVLEVEAMLLGVEGGDSTALTGYHDLQVGKSMTTYERLQ